MNRAVSTVILAASVSLSILGAALIAGPLDPPAGPVASTHKTLGEIEPRIPIGPGTTPGDATSLYRITQPGSYYLTGNITDIPAGKHAIDVAVSGVEIDMRGFAIRGTPSVATFSGINAGTGVTGTAIRNGTIEAMGLNGVSLWEGGRVESLHLLNNGGGGLALLGPGAAVRCTAQSNGNHGFQVNGSSLEHCSAKLNDAVGILAAGSSLRGCVSEDNTQSGFTVSNGTAIGCVSSSNGANGFICNSAVLESCSSTSNTGDGFRTTGSSALRGCSARFNTLNGFQLNEDYGAMLAECEASGNAGSGFDVRRGLVRGCRAHGNDGDGIRVRSDCTVQDSHCNGNGAGAAIGAGVNILGSANRIEGVQCTGNDTGIQATAADNFIARNTCRGNSTNFSVAAGNEMAPVITNPGSNSFSTMTPWSNVAY